MAEYFGRVAGSSVAAHIGDDELEILAPLGGQHRPILAAAAEAVQQNEWFTGAVNFEVEVYAIERFGPARRRWRRCHSVSSKNKTAHACAWAVGI